MAFLSFLRLNNIIIYRKACANNSFVTLETAIVLADREGAASKAKNAMWEVTLTGAPLLSLWSCYRLPAEPPLAKSNWKHRARGTRECSPYRSASCTESMVEKGGECKGKKSRVPCDNSLIGINNWKDFFLDLASLHGQEEELSIGGGRSRRPLWSMKLTPARSFVESLVQEGEIKTRAKKWTWTLENVW